MRNGRHIAEFYGTGVILATVGGFFDSYSYASRNKVFANAQTGNLVLLASNISKGNWLDSLHYFLPILSFFLGVLLVLKLKSKFDEHPHVHWHQLILKIEIVITAIVGFIPQDLSSVANILVSLTCAMQFEAFRRMNGKPYATTMCTGNLRSATDNLFHYIQFRDKENLKLSLQYYGIILMFLIGAALGAIFTSIMGIRSIFICVIGLVGALIVLKIDNRAEDKMKQMKQL